MHGFTIFLCTCIKNILKYAQILVTSGRLMIYHIEGHSRKYALPTASPLSGYCMCRGSGRRDRQETEGSQSTHKILQFSISATQVKNWYPHQPQEGLL